MKTGQNVIKNNIGILIAIHSSNLNYK